jgi:VanZ family protein
LEVIVINGTRESSRARGGDQARISRLASLFLPPLVVMAAIFLLSSQTSDPTDRPLWELALRKLGHVSEYLLLTLAWARALGGRISVAAAISVLYAVSDELHQTFVSGRHGTPVDVVIDSIGISLACLLYARRRRRTVGPSRPSAA